MPRTTKSLTAKAKHKKILQVTRGHYGARSRLFKTAKQSNIKSMQYAFRDRKNKKRAFRALWIARINAGARELEVPYSKLINSLTVLIRRSFSSIILFRADFIFEFFRTPTVRVLILNPYLE